MSKLNVNMEAGKGSLEGVTFAYIKFQEGSFKYGSKTEKEYCVDIIVDKATAKAWKKQFPKNTPKEIDTAEFESKYKIAPPFPDEDEQFVIKMKADCSISVDFPKLGLLAGDNVPYEWNTRPKLFIPFEGGVKDVTMTTLAANGSKGKVAFNIKQNDFGTFPKLEAILVEDLIEYVSSGGGAGSAFGTVVGGLNAGNGVTQQKADTTSEPEEVAEGNTDVPDDDIPF